MSILMSHPQHGNMHVYLEAEAVENEKNGWARVSAQDAVVAPAASPTTAPADVASPSIPFRRGPGRPSKKDTESIL